MFLENHGLQQLQLENSVMTSLELLRSAAPESTCSAQLMSGACRAPQHISLFEVKGEERH